MKRARRKGFFLVLSRIIIGVLSVYVLGYSAFCIVGKEKIDKLAELGEEKIKYGFKYLIEHNSEVIRWMEEGENQNSNDNTWSGGGRTKGYTVKNLLGRIFVKNSLENFIIKEGKKDNKDGDWIQMIKEMESENMLVKEGTSNETLKMMKDGEEIKNDSQEDKGNEAGNNNSEAKEVVALSDGKVKLPKVVGKMHTADTLGGFKNTIKSFYTVASTTSVKASDLNVSKALDMDLQIEGDNSKPQILIYHTHSQETFADSGGDKSKSIVQVGAYLAKILREQFSYNVLHDTSNYDLVDGKLDRNRAYEQSREGVAKILRENPSINLILDLHRDGVAENIHLVTEIDGKPTAKIMFFNGMSRLKGIGDIEYLYNPYLKENLALSLQMKINAEAYYPEFTRRNYINAYQYNLDLCKKSMLIEMGAQTNTFEEVKNAAEPLAVLINITMGKGIKG